MGRKQYLLLSRPFVNGRSDTENKQFALDLKQCWGPPPHSSHKTQLMVDGVLLEEGYLPDECTVTLKTEIKDSWSKLACIVEQVNKV